MSIPITLILYNYVFAIKYLSLLHILSILIVIALGTDDVFVFNDIWNQSGQIKFLKVDLNRRLAYTFRKSSKAMIVTSITTMFSFLATGFS